MNEEGKDRQKTIMGDFGYLGITLISPKAILPHKRPPHKQLAEPKKK
jgi:hypothetical protein